MLHRINVGQQGSFDDLGDCRMRGHDDFCTVRFLTTAGLNLRATLSLYVCYNSGQYMLLAHEGLYEDLAVTSSAVRDKYHVFVSFQLPR